MREDLIHIAVRRFLKNESWQLIAGQYPNGTDDELSSLNIADPKLARDNSPDHRRHSKNKLVPDLIARKQKDLLLVEMKPYCDKSDEKKLLELVLERRSDFDLAFRDFIARRGIVIDIPLEELNIIPALAFDINCPFEANDNFWYFLVKDIDTVILKKNIQ